MLSWVHTGMRKDGSEGSEGKDGGEILCYKLQNSPEHITMSSMTEEPRAELRPEASHMPPAKISEGWFLSEFSYFQAAAAEQTHVCDAYLTKHQRTFLTPWNEQRQNKPHEP